MGWAKLAVLALQVALNLIAWAKQSQAMEAGRDEEIARAATAVLVETQTGKRILAEVMAMTDEQVDKGLKELEP